MSTTRAAIDADGVGRMPERTRSFSWEDPSATTAAGLAPSGAAITILERGGFLQDSPAVRDATAIFRSASYESSEATDVGTPDQAENTRRFVILPIPE